MNPGMASALVRQRQRELAREASRHNAARRGRGGEITGAGHASAPSAPGAPGAPSARRIPRYRVSWSRVSLPAVGAAGRRQRSWVIVISATRGL